MARREEAREDLLREATALVERAELRVLGYDQPVVVGFRRDGAGSLFLGSDLVYQFNSQRALRRAYAEVPGHNADLGEGPNSLIKAESGRLVVLRRQRLPDQSLLLRTELTPTETGAFLSDLREHFARVLSGLLGGTAAIERQVPEGADLVPRIVEWLQAVTREIQVADRPHAR